MNTDIYNALVIALAISVIEHVPMSMVMIEQENKHELRHEIYRLYSGLNMSQAPINREWLVDDAMAMLLNPSGFRFLKTTGQSLFQIKMGLNE